MGKRLKTYVHVLGDDGDNHVFGPQDEVPQEFAEKIGDHAWVDEDEPLPDNRAGVVHANLGDGPVPTVESDDEDDSDSDDEDNEEPKAAPRSRAGRSRSGR